MVESDESADDVCSSWWFSQFFSPVCRGHFINTVGENIFWSSWRKRSNRRSIYCNTSQTEYLAISLYTSQGFYHKYCIISWLSKRKTIKRDIEPLSVNQSSNFYLLICQRILNVRNVLKIHMYKQTKPIKTYVLRFIPYFKLSKQNKGVIWRILWWKKQLVNEREVFFTLFIILRNRQIWWADCSILLLVKRVIVSSGIQIIFTEKIICKIRGRENLGKWTHIVNTKWLINNHILQFASWTCFVKQKY